MWMEGGKAIAEWGIGSLWAWKKGSRLDLIGVRDIPHGSIEN